MKKRYLLLFIPLMAVFISGCSQSKTIDEGTNKLKNTVETGASDMKKQQDSYWDSGN